jgi:hypothetical protein
MSDESVVDGYFDVESWNRQIVVGARWTKGKEAKWSKGS